MGRSPFCEKTGLRKGPWIPEEDQMLVAYIQRHGHGNWRALPKQAGLLRCGKSCRLRWINYLRPDIKRGNFSKEEEETIIKLHETLGNRWSTIAARLPGRTDNEIKNVWHTHLKKRLKQKQATPVTKRLSTETPKCDASTLRESEPMNFPTHLRFESPACALVSPQQSSSDDFSSITESSAITSENHNRGIKEEYIRSSGTFPEIDESFWSEALSTENSGMPEDNPAIKTYPQLELPFSPVCKTEPICSYGLNTDDGMDFWYNVFIKAEELPEWPEF